MTNLDYEVEMYENDLQKVQDLKVAILDGNWSTAEEILSNNIDIFDDDGRAVYYTFVMFDMLPFEVSFKTKRDGRVIKDLSEKEWLMILGAANVLEHRLQKDIRFYKSQLKFIELSK